MNYMVRNCKLKFLEATNLCGYQYDSSGFTLDDKILRFPIDSEYNCSVVMINNYKRRIQIRYQGQDWYVGISDILGSYAERRLKLYNGRGEEFKRR